VGTSCGDVEDDTDRVKKESVLASDGALRMEERLKVLFAVTGEVVRPTEG
jgi:hypothetical protein